MNEQLLPRNRANAEPTMRAAAQRVGAVLPSAEAEVFETSPLCGLRPNSCLGEVESLPPQRKKANSRWPFVSLRTRADEFRTSLA